MKTLSDHPTELHPISQFYRSSATTNASRSWHRLPCEEISTGSASTIGFPRFPRVLLLFPFLLSLDIFWDKKNNLRIQTRYKLITFHSTELYELSESVRIFWKVLTSRCGDRYMYKLQLPLPIVVVSLLWPVVSLECRWYSKSVGAVRRSRVVTTRPWPKRFRPCSRSPFVRFWMPQHSFFELYDHQIIENIEKISYMCFQNEFYDHPCHDK